MKFLDKKITLKQLPVLFKNYLNRNIFIWDYPYFGSDGNNEFYINFVDTNIYNSIKYKNQEDAIELSIKLDFFKKDYLDAISKIIYSKRSSWIKLLASDWLFQ